MLMFEFLSPSRHDAGPLSNAAAADQFWRLLPRRDPFAAQKSVSDALADFATGSQLSRDQVRALLELDARARNLTDAFAFNYRSGDQPRTLEKRGWQSAFLLSLSFREAFVRGLQLVRSSPSARGWGEYVPTLLLRVFQHSQIECLLRPFVPEHLSGNSWADVHGAYRHADKMRLLQQPVVTMRWRDERSEATTLEREYIHVLLIEFINRGQFSPYDAFWLTRRIPRWSATLSLSAECGGDSARGDDAVLGIDLDSAQGLTRLALASQSGRRYLDPAPVRASIDADIASLRNPANGVDSASSLGRARQLKLLRKVNAICAPKPAHVNRRGERRATASHVECVVGLSDITRMLRDQDREKATATSAPVPEVEEITITAHGGYTDSSASTAHRGGPHTTARSSGSSVTRQRWQLKDRSESGCGLRARLGDATRLVPGALIAFRESVDSPWTLGVVRRLQKRAGDEADIGVEYIGQNPSRIALQGLETSGPLDDGASTSAAGRFAALYLPESARQPTMPFKTLVLSPREYEAGRPLFLPAADASYTVRLKEPIEEQDEFIWLPYEVLARYGLVDKAIAAIDLPPNRASLAESSAA
jgi:hypothetical protein